MCGACVSVKAVPITNTKPVIGDRGVIYCHSAVLDRGVNSVFKVLVLYTV